MRKVILKLDLHDDKAKQKAMKMVSGLSGLDSIAMDMKEKKMTVVGDVDPVDVVRKLRKSWRTADLLSVGPAKEPEKKKEEGKKGDDNKKKNDPNEQIAEMVKLYRAYNPHMTTHYYVHSIEENPNACAIC